MATQPRRIGHDPALPAVRCIIEQGPDVLFRVRLTPQPKLDYVNRAVLAMTGYPPE
jgi:hypothetical protein